MQVVECVGYVKPAVVELFGQSGHLDLEMLFARRLQAVGGQKGGDAGGKRWRNRLPRTVEKPLRLSGQKIEQVDAEDGHWRISLPTSSLRSWSVLQSVWAVNVREWRCTSPKRCCGWMTMGEGRLSVSS